MRTKLTKALDDCLEMMSKGESIEACLAKYKNVKKQLEPLLNTALSISSLPGVVPSDKFREAASERLIARLHREANQARTVELKQGTSLLDELAITAQRLWQAVTGIKKVAVPVAFSLLVIIVASFSASNFLSPSPALASGCTLSILSGSVEVQAPEGNGKQGADGMTLDIGTRVRTASDASALLTFFDGSTLKLEPGTDIEIQQLKYDEEKAITIVLKQWMGRTWSRVEKMADAGSHYEIETPSASAVVRGTLFATEVDAAGATTVATTEGLVSVEAQGEEVYVPASEQTHVESGAVPSKSSASPPPVTQIIINVDAPAIGSVIDPSGASTGLLQGGISINQISGSRSLFTPAGKQVITIPQPRSGEYTLALRYLTEGVAHFNIQGISDGDVSFEYAGDYEGLDENGWLIHITVRIVNDRITESQVSEVKSLGVERPEKIVKVESAKGKTVSVEAIAQHGEEKQVQDKGAELGPDVAQSQGYSGQGQGQGNSDKPKVSDQSQVQVSGDPLLVIDKDKDKVSDDPLLVIDKDKDKVSSDPPLVIDKDKDKVSSDPPLVIDKDKVSSDPPLVIDKDKDKVSSDPPLVIDKDKDKVSSDQSQVVVIVDQTPVSNQSQGQGSSDQSQGQGSSDQSQGQGNSDQGQGQGSSDQGQSKGDQQQAESDAESARQQAESDAESARQQAESDADDGDDD